MKVFQSTHNLPPLEERDAAMFRFVMSDLPDDEKLATLVWRCLARPVKGKAATQ